MPYNVNRDSGFAERQSWIQINDSTIPTLTGSEGNTNISKDKRFASLVYSVNPSQLNISGATIEIDKVGLKSSDEVGVTSGNLNVYDVGVIEALQDLHNRIINLEIDKNYSIIIEEDISGNVYFAQAPIGTSVTANNWRIQKLDSQGSRSWAANGTFSLPATSPLSGHIFNY